MCLARLSVSLFLPLFTYFFNSISLCSHIYIPICLSVHLSIYSSIYIIIQLSMYLSSSIPFLSLFLSASISLSLSFALHLIHAHQKLQLSPLQSSFAEDDLIRNRAIKARSKNTGTEKYSLTFRVSYHPGSSFLFFYLFIFFFPFFAFDFFFLLFRISVSVVSVILYFFFFYYSMPSFFLIFL